MSLSPEAVKKIAHLARLSVSQEDIKHYANKLSQVIEFIEEMNKIDTSAIDPLAHPLNLADHPREDVISEANLREIYQRLAPEVEAGLYLVPQVIEEAT